MLWGGAIFDYWFNQASSEEAKVLRVVADAETPLSAKEIREMAKSGQLQVSSRNIAKYLQRLVEKKLLSKIDRGLYEVPDRMFRAYIRTRSD
ncbi:BlaI/MecI/CopY family transcriptional regulator [Candidatus Poribacteria bacterium]|nr:BlaI/MecI/CopY family transcriptional regulator [Candidatus Poribacteria bacterium]